MPFRCHKCNNEIQIDKSFENMPRAQAKLLISKVGKRLPRTYLTPNEYISKDRLDKYEQAQAQARARARAHKDGNIQAIHSEIYPYSKDTEQEDLEQSFVYILDTEDTEVSPVRRDNKLDKRDQSTDDQLPDFSKIKTLNQVFEILSINQDIDHPMCSECSDLLTNNYKLKFDQSQREKENYTNFLRKLKERDSDRLLGETSILEELGKSDNEIRELEKTEKSKLAELEELEAKHQQLKDQLKNLQDQSNLLEVEQNEIYQKRNELGLKLRDKHRTLDQVKSLYEKHLNHLDELRKFNIFKRLFDISFETEYGSINGFRLGYRVPWPESNVALGQIVSMLQFMKDRLGLTLEHYQLVPMGSESFLLKLPPAQPDADPVDKTSSVLHLYSSNEFTIGKLFNFNKLDVSLIAVLDIISQFEVQLSYRDNELALPYKISVKRGTIGGKSIRVTSNKQWTESCRYLLINLSWILSYVSAQHTG